MVIQGKGDSRLWWFKIIMIQGEGGSRQFWFKIMAIQDKGDTNVQSNLIYQAETYLLSAWDKASLNQFASISKI